MVYLKINDKFIKIFENFVVKKINIFMSRAFIRCYCIMIQKSQVDTKYFMFLLINIYLHHYL